METKRCSKCGKVKPVSEFYWRKDSKKYRNECKECVKKRTGQYGIVNSEKIRKIKRKYYENNLDYFKNKNAGYRKNNPDKMREYSKKWKKNNPDKVSESHKKYYRNNVEKIEEWRKNNAELMKHHKKTWYEKNREKTIERSNMWRINNKDRYNELKRESAREERQNIEYRLSHSISRSIWGYLKNGKDSKTIKEIFYPNYIPDLMKQLESLFTEGMSWENYGEWHIDHKKPVSWFNFTSYKDKEFKECWALSNLQPKWAEDNLSKGNRYIG